MVADASYSSIWSANFLACPQSWPAFPHPARHGGAGLGPADGDRRQLARPDAPIFCLAGDGGFAHVWSELETARRNKLPVVLAVLNNQILGYQKDAEDCDLRRPYQRRLLRPVDHAMIARACGCRGLRIERAQDIAPALKEGFSSNEVTVLDIVTDQPRARRSPRSRDISSRQARTYRFMLSISSPLEGED